MSSAESCPLQLIDARVRLPQLAHCWRDRVVRVTLLMALVGIMSLLDLYMTLQQMTSHGMFEGNPLVVLLVQWTNSAIGVALYKILTVAIGVGLIYRLRRHASAELGAWVMTLVLVVVMVQWARYAAFMHCLDPLLLEELQWEVGWVMIGESD